jgi:hypothetical protein
MEVEAFYGFKIFLNKCVFGTTKVELITGLILFPNNLLKGSGATTETTNITHRLIYTATLLWFMDHYLLKMQISTMCVCVRESST